MAYRELWADRKKRIQQSSPFRDLPGWGLSFVINTIQHYCFLHFHLSDLMAVIVKSEDDLRQEQMAMQLISCFHDIFKARNLPLWLRPYALPSTLPSAQCNFVLFILSLSLL